MPRTARRLVRGSRTIYSLLLLALAWSCGSDDRGVTPVDNVPPRPVDDLRVLEVDSSSVLLTWTATGDDDTVGVADRYDLRHTTFPFALWDEMTIVAGLPRPGPPGSQEVLRVAELRAETRYWFRIAVGDRASNWSIPSDPMEVVTSGIERIPPASIRDLTVIATEQTSVTLAWTATGDDGHEGTASLYDLRYSIREITEETWDGATRASGLPAPLPSGTVQHVVVRDLRPLTIHYFAIKVADDRENWSPLSNVVAAYTVGPLRKDFRPGARLR